MERWLFGLVGVLAVGISVFVAHHFFHEWWWGLVALLLGFVKGLTWRFLLRKCLFFIVPPLLPVVWRQWGDRRKRETVERIKAFDKEARARWENLPLLARVILKPVLLGIALVGVLASMIIVFFFSWLPIAVPGSGFFLPVLRARLVPVLARLAAGRGLDDLLLPAAWRIIPDGVRVPIRQFLGWRWRKIVRRMIRKRRSLERQYREGKKVSPNRSTHPVLGME